MILTLFYDFFKGKARLWPCISSFDSNFVILVSWVNLGAIFG